MIQRIKFAAGRIALASILLLAVAGPGALAQELKIGVVDLEEVTRRSSSIQSRMDSAEKSMEGRKSELEEKVLRLQRMQRDLRDQRSVLSESELKEQETQVAKLNEEVKDMQYDINKQIERLQTQVIEPELSRIEETIEKVARDGRYDLVLIKDAVLFSSERVDVTPLIIQSLDAGGGSAAAAPDKAPDTDESEE